MSVPMREIYALAEAHDKELLATDPRLRGTVIVREQHGMGFLFYEDAFVVSKGEWYCVFTEHHGFHVYHSEDYDVAAYDGRKAIDEAPF